MASSFLESNEPVDPKGMGGEKWDLMERNFGIPNTTGLAMGVADTDFRAPESVQRALSKILDNSVYGYHGDETNYLNSIVWWMQTRHGWTVDPKSIFSSHGLVNGFGLCVDTFTDPGDQIILFSPVYHAFERVLKAANREITFCPLALEDGIYRMDLSDTENRLSGGEKMIVLCSPHNPGGRVWSRQELEELARFAEKHDLIIVSDEIHHDLLYPGAIHTPMSLINGTRDRLIMLTAATKTFNIAGIRCGNIIIESHELREKLAKRFTALGIDLDIFGVGLTPAAYSRDSIPWLEAQLLYLNENRKVFDEGISEIPGASSMQLESTFLAWVNFSDTGLSPNEVCRRIKDEAQIAASNGEKFGPGGESFIRFNIGTHRSNITEAIKRLRRAFT